MKKLGARKAYYFGDAVDDIEAAIMANVMPIGVIPPSANDAKLQQLLVKKGATKVTSDVNEVAELIA